MATVTESDDDRRRLHRRARRSTATSAGCFVETYRREWFPHGREMIQGNRADRQAGCVVGLHYHLHQADYWYVPFGAARVVLHDLRAGSPTDGATLGARPRRASTAPTTTAACSSRPASRTASPR